MKATKLEFDTDPNNLRVGYSVWDSSQRIRVIQLYEGQIWNFYGPGVDMQGRPMVKIEPSLFVPGLT